ncbi:hypothetical protein [Desulfocurvibacter africanus]|uniref:Uncharacterized protein n=1 Tax=Desulfocurvibacter africanus subsp. africanus str. Walvis Bay TaxID=690850 RepID=F3YXJ4_DESAF|nr:hypothetical protein [Desulfocurvibacter africanus]EGJ51771.1 hypothetical protein Desaf_3487 [Desulfocurvibacter africanus subsp. africanus str. Walvis Bay]
MALDISSLDDAMVLAVLGTLARSRIRSGECITEPTAEIVAALSREFAIAPSITPVSPSEFARASLQLLAQDPAMAQNIEALTTGPRPKAFIDPGTVAVVVAAFVALQTEVKITRNTNGQWTFSLRKPTMSDSLLRKVAEMFIVSFKGGQD